jgi:hypothetical protein
MIQAITIEREFGCGASEIAAKLAELLGWKLWDHELTQEIARLTNSTPKLGRDVAHAQVHTVDGRDFGFDTAADEIAQIVKTFVKQNPQRI